MSETREQFRYRLGEVSFQGRGLDSFDWKEAYEHSFDADHDMDAAEAVYAQAIRDLLDHIGGMTIHDDVGGSESTDKMLRDFAAERGINFGEG